MKRIGVDAGGTFTDAVLWDDELGVCRSVKVPSQPQNPAAAVLRAARKAADSIDLSQLRDLTHGTTVATNAVLERSGDRIALLTTQGFRDVLEIARLSRPPELLYDLLAPAVSALVQRRDRFEVVERLDHTGQVLVPLSEDRVREIARVIKSRGITSAAVVFLHAHLNAAHERRCAEILAEEIPGLHISTSHAVLAEIGEYERTATTALNAYLLPIVEPYLNEFDGTVQSWSPATRRWVMQSNGGVALPHDAAQMPVNLLLSGPSGGVVAGRWLATQTQTDALITIDMGGTSFDVCVLKDQKIPVVSGREYLELPIQIPTVDVSTIGTGGGSIASVDPGGAFTVGPKSAGAVPGPACYGNGGTEATVTDANVVLGYLTAEDLEVDGLDLDVNAAWRVCESLARQLGVSTVRAAMGIRSVSNKAMGGAIRAATVGRGDDPREFTIAAFGGAGPMHAVDIARELSIQRVIVPPVAGCLSALGMVVSDIVHHYSRSILQTVTQVQHDATLIVSSFEDMTAAAIGQLKYDGVPDECTSLELSLDMRYVGQRTTITVGVGSLTDPTWLTRAEADYRRVNLQANGFDAPEESVEIVTARLRAVGLAQAGAANSMEHERPPARRHRARATLADREVYVSDTDRRSILTYDRCDLEAGAMIDGPSVVRSSDSTIVLPEGASATIDLAGNMIIQTGVSP